jgi:hypothetical protein
MICSNGHIYNYAGDLSGVIATFIMNLFILIVSIAGAWTYGRAPILPHYRGSVASLLPYIFSLEGLKGDNRGVVDEIDKNTQIEILKEKRRRYGFGTFCNENSLDASISVLRGIMAMDLKGKSMFNPRKEKIVYNKQLIQSISAS